MPPLRAAVGNPAQAVGGQGVQPLAAVPAVHGLGEVHGRPGYRAHLFGRALEKTGVFWENPESCISGVRKRKRTSCI